MEILYTAILIPLTITTVVVIYNFLTAPNLNNSFPVDEEPLVSVLVPARNEEENIRNCVTNIAAQDYPNLEIVVLDDESEDGTPKILSELSSQHKNLTIIKGGKLREGWLGKNWACAQLAEKAAGRYMLFIDADVEIERETVSGAVRLMTRKRLSMLSIFPTQIIRSLGEWLTVPSMKWLLLTFLPLRFVYASKNRSFAAANGQFIMFDRREYRRLGGHEAVKSEIVEDMEFIRIFKEEGQPVMTGIGSDKVFCRMYRSITEGIDGFSKNFFPGFGIPSPLFVSLLALLAFLYFSPFILAWYYPILFTAVALIIFQKLLISLIGRVNIFLNLLLHPLQIIIMVIIGFISIYRSKKKSNVWKGRSV